MRTIRQLREASRMLEEPRTYTGVWWLPHTPKHTPTGTLTLTEDTFELEVVGNLEEGRHAFLFEFADVPRIIGTTIDNKVVTLDRCRTAGMTPRSPGPPTTRYTPSVVVIGGVVWADEEDQIELDEIRVGFSDLSEWVGVSGIHHGPPITPDGRWADKFEVALVPLETRSYPLRNGLRVQISFEFQTTGFTRRPTSVALNQTARLGVRFDSPSRMSDVYEAIYQLRNLLTLAVGRPVRVLDVIGVIDSEHIASPPERPSRTTAVELLWRFANVDAPHRDMRDDEMLFTRPQVEDRLSDILNAWWEKEPVLKPIFDLYFGTITSRAVANHVHFLMFAQALETYHRRTSNRTQLPKAEFRRRRTEIAAAASSDEVREWIDEKMNYANELPLRERLYEILAICPIVTSRVVGDEIDAFVSDTVDTRNYRTHYTKKLERKAAKGMKLGRLTYQLKALVETVLLHELGFSCEELVAMLERGDRFGMVDRFRDAEAAAVDE